LAAGEMAREYDKQEEGCIKIIERIWNYNER
jgi:hypothetical protein